MSVTHFIDLEYAYDEEANGFEEPAGQPAAMRVDERLALGLIALGAVGVVIGVTTSAFRGWIGLLGSIGVVAAGAALLWWSRLRHTPPGIENDRIAFASITSRGALGWMLGVFLTAFYICLYWYPPLLDGAVRLVGPLSHALRQKPASQYFLYSFLYTVLVLVFGIRMVMKYRRNRYQLVRTGSVMFFQLVFAFLIPQIMVAIDQPEFYFTYFWPLQPNYLFPTDLGHLWRSGGLGVFLAFWGFIASFVAVPALTYFFGKRWYCSWVCGCGGLAETMGDPFRQLSAKSSAAWKFERWSIHLVLVAIVIVTASLWIDATTGAFGGASETMRRWYKFGIILVWGGVIGVGFYPIMGSRVWCRFGCPQAAILGILQRYFSRFRITTNGDQCMSCGNCSTYCEMGIDVRAYAQRGANIVRASCVGCGVCAAVCPRGVLKLENGAVGDRFPNADRPLAAIRDSLRPGPAAS